MPVAIALPYFLVPLFPAFITLTAVTIPGVCLISRSASTALLFLMALLAMCALPAVFRRPFPRLPTLGPLMLWIASAIVAAMLGFDPAAGLVFIGILVLGAVWHVAILRYYALPGVSRAIYWSFIVSGGFASTAAILMVIARRPADQFAIGHGRAIGTFILPGELAGYLIVFLPIAFALARRYPDGRLRMVSAASFVIGALAFVLTFSRAGWMGLAAAAAFYVFARGTVRRRYAPLILLAGLAVVLALFNVHHDPAENYTRLSIWAAAVEMIRRFPLTGVGPFDFARVYPLVRLPDGDAQAFHAHGFLLTIAAETGMVGLVAVLVLWWRFAQTFYDRVRRARPEHAALALAVAAGLLGTWVQGLIDTVSVAIFGLWLPSMALALASADEGPGDLR